MFLVWLWYTVSIKARFSNQNNLGVALYKQNRVEEAPDWFKKSCEINNEESERRLSYLNYGCTLAILGRRNEAEMVAQFLYENNEKSDFLLDDIANIYYLTQNYREVVKLYKECQYGFAVELWQFYLYALTKCGEEQLAYKLMEESIENYESEILEYEQEDELYKAEFIDSVHLAKSENIQLKELMKSLKTELSHNWNLSLKLKLGAIYLDVQGIVIQILFMNSICFTIYHKNNMVLY
jgi:tetratricopeptide (TPR) repeat protein